VEEERIIVRSILLFTNIDLPYIENPTFASGLRKRGFPIISESSQHFHQALEKPAWVFSCFLIILA